jgi:heme-degrading monooxygenase HmoA
MKYLVKYFLSSLVIALLLINVTNCNMETNKPNRDIYTLGIWTVKSDKEKEFINEWTSFANWTSDNIKGAGKGYLLQDKENALRFISFGPWKDESSIQKWRDSEEFKNFVTKVKGLCDDFQPNTLMEVSTSK